MNQAANEIWSAIDRNDYRSVLRNMRSFLASSCLHPTKMQYPNRYNGKQETIYVPCGKCEQCRNTKGNMLSSRLYLDALQLKHVYMVTLHFKAYDRAQDIPESLHGMCWHYDDLCSTKHLAFHPCFLDYGVFQKFFKHLRMNMVRDQKRIDGGTPLLKYFIGCEYGSKYGRPHAHIILISNIAVPRETIARVWKYGSFDYEDLMKNGTMENVGNLASKKCFKYVAKYANKQDTKFCKDRYNMGLRYLIDCVRRENYIYNEETKDYLLSPEEVQKYVFKETEYIKTARLSAQHLLLQALPEQKDSLSLKGLRTLAYNYKKFGTDYDRYYGVEADSDIPMLDYWTPDTCLLCFGQRTRISSGSPVGKAWFDANREDYLSGLRTLPETPAPKSPLSVGRCARLKGNVDVTKDSGWKLSWPSLFNTYIFRSHEPYCIMQRDLAGTTTRKKIHFQFLKALRELKGAIDSACSGNVAFIKACQDYCLEHDTSLCPLSEVYFTLNLPEQLVKVCNLPYFNESGKYVKSYLYDTNNRYALSFVVECDGLCLPVALSLAAYQYSRSLRDYIYCEQLPFDSCFNTIASGFDWSKDEFEKHADDRKAKLIASQVCFEEPDHDTERVYVDTDDYGTIHRDVPTNYVRQDFRADALQQIEYIKDCWALFKGQKDYETFLKETDGLEIDENKYENSKD